MTALLFSLLSLASVAQAQDRDQDRVPDASDLCPDAREPLSTLAPGDGCPDADADHDQIVDDFDVCPTSAETVNGLQDLDGCPDTVPSAPVALASDPEPTRIGCWEGSGLFDVQSRESGAARLMPRADAPGWVGPSPLDCYAGISFQGLRVVHCASGSHEATLAMRVQDGRAIGFVVVRSGSGVERRSWSATERASRFDRHAVIDVIEAREGEVSACFDEARRDGATGRVVVRLTVTTAGDTTRVEVVSDTFAPARPAISACLVRLVDSVTVASPPTCGSVTLTFPFVFQLDP